MPEPGRAPARRGPGCASAVVVRQRLVAGVGVLLVRVVRARLGLVLAVFDRLVGHARVVPRHPDAKHPVAPDVSDIPLSASDSLADDQEATYGRDDRAGETTVDDDDHTAQDEEDGAG